MTEAKIARRSRVKPFLKLVNYAHLLPTRYSVDVTDIQASLNVEDLAEPATKKAACVAVKKFMEEKYKSGQSKWFFSKLRF